MADPERPATYDDLLAVPDPLVAEIVDGVLYTNARPASPHAHARSTLGMDIGGAYQRGRSGPGGWWILDEPELHLARDVLVPDLAGWRRARMPTMAQTPWFELAPDWVCEVLSPSTARLDRTAKMPAYARAGVRFAWLLDPLQRTLEVFELDRSRWVLLETYAGEAPVRARPFPEVPLVLGDLWIPGVGEPSPPYRPTGPEPRPAVG